jgi:hypothetical protein
MYEQNCTQILTNIGSCLIFFALRAPRLTSYHFKLLYNCLQIDVYVVPRLNVLLPRNAHRCVQKATVKLQAAVVHAARRTETLLYVHCGAQRTLIIHNTYMHTAAVKIIMGY